MGFRELGKELLDLAYPSSLYCICCNKIIDESRVYRLCDKCNEEIKWSNGRTCKKCGKLLSSINPSEICFNCRENEHEFDRGFTICEYNEHARSIVLSLKYGGRTDIAKSIAEMMSDKMLMIKESKSHVIKEKKSHWDSKDGYGEYDIALSVPMFKDKRKKRGFNQATLIAREFAKYQNIRCKEYYIQRVKDSAPMRGLKPVERKENINGAFRLTRYAEELRGKRILLIDDIYTTGATLDEISKLLRNVKPSKIDILTFAAGADVLKEEE